MEDRTQFGYEEVSPQEKTRRVRGVFDSVARKYDIMNDVMSGGLHRLWKRFAVSLAAPRAGQRVLDLAGGTGDLARLFAARVGPAGTVVHTDINHAMLAEGRDKLIDRGLVLPTVQCNAEALPFPDRGVRRRLHRLRPAQRHAQGCRAGGDAPRAAPGRRRGGARILARGGAAPPAYDWYSFNVLPRLGKLIADDASSYRYLAESIRVHPDQDTLKAMMEQAGFDKVEYHNLTAGVVAVHVGRVY